MSLIIKDADMPDSCYSCLLFDRLNTRCKHLNKRLDVDECRLGRYEKCELSCGMSTDCNYVDLAEKVTATYYDDEFQEWSEKTTTIEAILDSVCDNYTVITWNIDGRHKRSS